MAFKRIHPVMKTNWLEIVSNIGAVCGVFNAPYGAVALALNSSNGEPGLTFGMVRDESGMALLDIAGKPCGGVILFRGMPGMQLGDSEGNQRL